jgi:glycosyltransferase involved in cell wall biosynthesis
VSGSRTRRPFRLAVLTDNTEIGGSELSLAALVAGLGPHADVTVVGVDTAIVTRIASTRPGAGRVVVPPVTNRFDVKSMWSQRRAIAALSPDLVYASLRAPWACQYALLGACTVRGIQFVASERMALPPRSRGMTLLKRFTSAQLSAHLAVSESVARDVERDYRLPRGSIRVVATGVSETPLQPRPRVAAGPVIGTLSRHDPVKALDVLVRAAAKVPDAAVVIVGPNPHERGDLEQLAEALGVADRVQFVDWTDRPLDYLPSFDVLAVPSRYDASPRTVLEAMVASLPVVATCVGGIPEQVVPGETGLLVPPDDPDALAASLRTLLDDPALRERMGRAGRRRALEHFPYERMIATVEGIFEAVLAAPLRRAGRSPRSSV